MKLSLLSTVPSPVLLRVLRPLDRQRGWFGWRVAARTRLRGELWRREALDRIVREVRTEVWT